MKDAQFNALAARMDRMAALLERQNELLEGLTQPPTITTMGSPSVTSADVPTPIKRTRRSKKDTA